MDKKILKDLKAAWKVAYPMDEAIDLNAHRITIDEWENLPIIEIAIPTDIKNLGLKLKAGYEDYLGYLNKIGGAGYWVSLAEHIKKFEDISNQNLSKLHHDLEIKEVQFFDDVVMSLDINLDTKYKFGVLEAVKKILLENNRVPKELNDSEIRGAVMCAIALNEIIKASEMMSQNRTNEAFDYVDNANSVALWLTENFLNNEHSNERRHAGLRRVANDPKEAAMLMIEKEHSNLKPHQKTYGYKTQFAKDMQEKFPVIESLVSIERRIRKLTNKK